ncbi:NAD(P)-binding protein [Novosphingobium pituita]|uniref:NAD(P)/FAD-dependent oxidoreductase n=1 Tax=Novosphingobium pituita TaxID=3056842 RepID=A0ABQ6P963_9SPHN|nr:NAD(P)-binding protein [Novosphingobium sp. IK01]GMM61802.1 NAD(P)/FAD-dependent oxidoreductase [Novosphingobium sp. IK01]
MASDDHSANGLTDSLTDGFSRRAFVRSTTAAGATLATGLATGLGSALAQAAPALHPVEPGGLYPPLRTGMRGAHPGSFEVAHALRDGEQVGQALAGPASETYDLVVVGGGISGLSAALFYQDRHPDAKILILDNHDDFGGHAKRNEFMVRGHRLILNGGTAGIESPTPYSAQADGLLRRLGIDVPALAARYGDGESEDGTLAGVHLGRAAFFDKEHFGRDALVPLPEEGPLGDALAQAPLSPAARAQIAALEAGATDPLGAMPMAQRKDYLSTISYRDYLMKHGGLGEEALLFYQNRPLGWWCVGADGICALDAWGTGFFPGFKGLKLEKGGTMRMGYTPRGFASTGGSYDFHFPDGNATIARLLVARLIPGFMAPGITPEQSILAPCDYGALDRPGNAVRLRLSTPCVHAVNRDGAGVDLVTVHAQKPNKIAARHVVMACWSMIVPYLVPSLPAEQKAALHELVKEPLVYVSVALDNWRAFAKAGLGSIQFPQAFYHSASLDRPVTIGGHQGPRSPDDPILVHLTHIPHQPGLPEHDQSRAGRAQLLATDLARFEDEARDLLTRALGPHGFDATRDIAAITVNRWPHGYAPEYNALWDARTDDDPAAPHRVARRPFGAIALANSDTGRAAYTDSAIDQAWRAVGELLGTPAAPA